MGAGHFGQFEFMEVTEGKPYNRASPVGNAPLFPLRGASPGGGSFSGAMLLDAYESKR